MASTAATPAPLNLHFDADRLWVFRQPSDMCNMLLVGEVWVGSHGASHWNSADGQRPPTLDPALAAAGQTNGYRIYTPVVFSVLRPLLDHRNRATREFDTLGGMVGQDQFWINDFPQVSDGGHYLVLFSVGSLPAGQGPTEDWIVVYSAFPIDAQGMVVLQPAGSPTESGPGAPQPAIKLSLADVQQGLMGCPTR